MSNHLECPFCCSIPDPKQGDVMETPEPDINNKTQYAVHCYGCGAEGPVATTVEGAIKEWDTRNNPK